MLRQKASLVRLTVREEVVVLKPKWTKKGIPKPTKSGKYSCNKLLRG